MIDQSYLDDVNQRLTDLETEMSAPGITKNRKKFQELLGDHSHQKKLQKVAEDFLKVTDGIDEARQLAEDAASDPELKEMAEMELAELEAQLPDAEKEMRIALLPPDPQDARSAMLEIRAGTGGDEAALFAADLFRMYTRYAEAHKWTWTIMGSNASGLGGYKEVILLVEGSDVFKTLKYESGVHRVQRIPETEASGRIHTSAATVAVMPEAEEVEIDIKPEEIRVDVFRASGPGGQSVNTTDSAIRITHLPTGVTVQCQDEKSQHRNREKAYKVLQVRLLDVMTQEENAKRAGDRKGQIGTGDRSERIRTYNFPQNRVTDHRIGLTVYHLDTIIEGQIDELITPLYEHDVDARLRVELGTSGDS